MELSPGQRIASSTDVFAKRIKYKGSNEEDSAYSVWFIPKYLFGGVYHTDNGYEYLADAGENFPYKYSSVSSNSRNWKLVLNPHGANHYGCTADGEIYKDY